MAKALSAGTRKPYSGPVRSLVVAIDVGTTFSGVSYAILEPGEIPKIHGVTRFPGQEHVAGNTKIPSIIYYDRQGRLVAAGAEAENGSIISQAEDEGWIKVELFKLRLRPRTMQLHMNGMRFSPLPKKKTAVHVFGDFLAYLFHCTKMFITDTHANGAALWSAVENNIQFVLSHPNGWEGPQQSKMRRAAIYGGLIQDSNVDKARIWFVTEGEASLHACVLNGLANDVLSSPSQHGFLIADAGGGTLDISSYAIRGTDPLVIEEIAPPDCIFAGSVFVSRRAREFLEEKLKNSKYGTPDALDHITRKFDESTKRLFRDKKELQFIPFGSPLDKDPSVGIRNGQLKLTGMEVASLFEPSVEAAVRAIKAQIDASKGTIRSVFLVGGYAASPWLFSQLQDRLRSLVVVSRPDSQTSKAVADGAIGFFCDHHVSARMSRFMYGVEYLRDFNPADPDHVARRERLCELPSGPKLLPDAFDCILARSVKVKESTVFTRKYSTELTSLSLLSVFEVEIWCYRGGNEIPMWIARHSDAFSTLCIVQADLSVLSGSAVAKVGKNGRQYWTIVFSVEIHFGLTEFKARIKWVDSGNTKYGPATIIYNEHGHRAADEDEPDSYPEDDHVTGGTPRSERLRSLPASRAVSRARTPTDHHHPSSPGTYDGNSLYTGDGNSIKGVPPPSISPHDYTRERTLSKPATPKISSPIPPAQPQMERELSSDSRRTSVGAKGRDKYSSASVSRASSIAGGKIGEALSAVWGAGDPQLRSPVQHHPPYSPQPPTHQAPIPQASTPQAPPMQPPTHPHTQPPTQPQTQAPTQAPTPKSSKSKSRKASTATTAQASPQPPPQLPEGFVASHHVSPAQAPIQAPATVVPTPKPTAPPSPKLSIIAPSRGISRIASPSVRSEKALSPLNPSAQVPSMGLELEFANAETAPAAFDGLGSGEEVPFDNQAGEADDTGGQGGWDLGDNGGFGTSTGHGNEADEWENNFHDGAEGPLGETFEMGVPGSFDDQTDSKGLLEDPSQPPLVAENAADGGATTISGSISSLLNADAVSGLGNRLSSTFGLLDKKEEQPTGGSAMGFGSSFGFGSAKNGGGVGSFLASKASSWGKAASTLGSKAATPNPQASPKVLEQAPALGKKPSTTSSKGATLNPQASPEVPEQGFAWTRTPSTKGSRAATPNFQASPKVPEAQDNTTAWGGKTPSSKSVAGSKVATPQPPASPKSAIIVADASQALAPEEFPEHSAVEADALVEIAQGQHEEILAQESGEMQEGQAQEQEQEQEQEESAPAASGPAEELEQEESTPAASIPPAEEQATEVPAAEPETADAEEEWGFQLKPKKNKKGKAQQPAQKSPDPADEDEWGSVAKGKKNKKNKKGGNNFGFGEEGQDGGEDAGGAQQDNGEGKLDQQGGAGGDQEEELNAALDDLLGDDPEQNEQGEEEETRGAKKKDNKGNQQADKQTGKNKPKKKKR